MEDNIEIKEEQSVENIVAEKVEPSDNAVSKDTGFFRYYMFVLFNSIIGFMLVLYFSRYLIDTMADKSIIDLRNMKIVASIVFATSVTMIFMLIALVLRKFFKKIFFSEIFMYVYVGALTTIINILAWNFCFRFIYGVIVKEEVAWKIAEVIAFIIAVLFAFFADKIVVFKSYSFMPSKLFTEMGSFIGARIFTELVNIGIMYFIIDYKQQKPLLGKVVASVVIIVLNYLLSKFIIFRKKNNHNEK